MSDKTRGAHVLVSRFLDGANRKRRLAGYRLNRDPRPLIPNSDPISSSFVITSIKSNERQLRLLYKLANELVTENSIRPPLPPSLSLVN